MTTTHRTAHEMRVYPLDPQELTQEQIAVIFAMTSRSPEAFDEIKERVTEAKAADFNEKWVVGYGHASVAEHAVIHMAVENISRLACDELEDNRLASFTEKSSRYQVLERGSYHVPADLRGHELERTFTETCDLLFETYHALLERTQAHLKSQHPQREGERDGAYNLRIRRESTDSCRFVLPAATLTNVGVTMNARSLEHAITKLLSSELAESREIGKRLKEEGQAIAPTLVKYADRSEYLAGARQSRPGSAPAAVGESRPRSGPAPGRIKATLVQWDEMAEEALLTALLYRVAGSSYAEVRHRIEAMDQKERKAWLDHGLANLGPFDAPVRELEAVDFLFELEMDYGAYREYRRHRMQTCIPQPLTVREGYIVPPLVVEAGAEEAFQQAMQMSAAAYEQLLAVSQPAASMVATHAHIIRTLAKLNLREGYHLLKLRTAKQAHFTIREVALQMLAELERVHPRLIKYANLREPAE